MTDGADTDQGSDLIEIPVIFPNAGFDSRESWAALLADSFGANAAERHALRQAAMNLDLESGDLGRPWRAFWCMDAPADFPLIVTVYTCQESDMAGRSLIEMAGGYAPHAAAPPIVDTLSLEDGRPCARVMKMQVLDDDSLIHRVTYATVARGDLLLFDIEHPNPARNAANLTEFEALVGEIAKEVTVDGIR